MLVPARTALLVADVAVAVAATEVIVVIAVALLVVELLVATVEVLVATVVLPVEPLAVELLVVDPVAALLRLLSEPTTSLPWVKLITLRTHTCPKKLHQEDCCGSSKPALMLRLACRIAFDRTDGGQDGNGLFKGCMGEKKCQRLSWRNETTL